LFLLIPLGLSFHFPSRKRGSVQLLWTFFIPLVLFVGLRNEVGPDWLGYEENFRRFSNLAIEWKELISLGEPAYFMLNNFSEEMGWGLHGVMFVCALLFLWGLVSYSAKTPDPWLALGVVLPYLVFVVGMSAIRQAAAIGICYYMLAHRKDWPLLVNVALIGLATMFHTSAAVFMVFLLYESRGRLLLRLFVGRGGVVSLRPVG
jgi:hypothetical protein